ncbi:hypothetical protein OIV83_002919 [Microbotryomycetes sp. JL201]|nr:hypothetical protein OIV83_002919 [Microbotryomycetes sp. JL201]
MMTPSFYTADPSSGQLKFPQDPQKPFVVVHKSFLDVIGKQPKLRMLAKSDSLGQRAFHEAGIYIRKDNEVYLTSNLVHDPDARNQISKIKLSALEEGKTVDNSWEDVSTQPEVVTGNGGTIWGDKLLLCSQGLGQEIPSALWLVDPYPPYNATNILNNFHGRPFNAINDVVILPAPSDDPAVPHPTTCRTDIHHLPHTTIWFTDPTYGFVQGYKPRPLLPNQVYCFNPTTGDVRCVADGLKMPNGLCFNWEGTKLYVTDTGAVTIKPGETSFSADSAEPATIYVYDVVRPSHCADLTAEGPTLHNKRVFAFADCGVPDGIKTDRAGNVYSGCGDGIHVWNAAGTLIGKVILPPDAVPSQWPSTDPAHKHRLSANFCFADNKLVIFAQDRIYEATLGENTLGAI